MEKRKSETNEMLTPGSGAAPNGAARAKTTTTSTTDAAEMNAPGRRTRQPRSQVELDALDSEMNGAYSFEHVNPHASRQQPPPGRSHPSQNNIERMRPNSFAGASAGRSATATAAAAPTTVTSATRLEGATCHGAGGSAIATAAATSVARFLATAVDGAGGSAAAATPVAPPSTELLATNNVVPRQLQQRQQRIFIGWYFFSCVAKSTCPRRKITRATTKSHADNNIISNSNRAVEQPPSRSAKTWPGTWPPTWRCFIGSYRHAASSSSA